MAQCLGNSWKNCSSLRVYISGLIFWGQGDKQDFFRKKSSCFYTNICLDEENGFPRFLATIVNLPNIAGALNIFVWHNSEPSYTNQDATLLLHVPDQLINAMPSVSVASDMSPVLNTSVSNWEHMPQLLPNCCHLNSPSCGSKFWCPLDPENWNKWMILSHEPVPIILLANSDHSGTLHDFLNHSHNEIPGPPEFSQLHVCHPQGPARRHG